MNVNMTDATRGAGCVGDFAFAYFTEMLRVVSRCMSTKLRCHVGLSWRSSYCVVMF
jgi:hypothetical protein